ncbi:hypothetical protein ACSBR1_010591 [Camellia fascicularis]
MSMALLVQVACLMLPICLDFLDVLATGCRKMALQLVLLLIFGCLVFDWFLMTFESIVANKDQVLNFFFLELILSFSCKSRLSVDFFFL